MKHVNHEQHVKHKEFVMHDLASEAMKHDFRIWSKWSICSIWSMTSMLSMWSMFTEECEAWSAAYHVSELCKSWVVCEACDAWFSKWGMWSMLSMNTEMWIWEVTVSFSSSVCSSVCPSVRPWPFLFSSFLAVRSIICYGSYLIRVMESSEAWFSMIPHVKHNSSMYIVGCMVNIQSIFTELC